MITRCAYNTLHQFVSTVFFTMNCSEADALQAADILLRADLRGIHSHGLVRLKEYVKLYSNGRINAQADIRIIHQTPGTALMDGDKGFGMVVAPRAMQLAIDKARQAGTGWVAVRNTNHFGIAGHYAMMALEHDMIGIAMTNANPLVAPTRSKHPLLGTNPVATAIPAMEQPPFVADFATAPIARGKLDQMAKRSQVAPEGVLQDATGQPTQQADILCHHGAIKTLGGDTLQGGHKGYCMSAIVDILTAVLPGANFGPLVIPTLAYLPDEQNNRTDNGIGHFFGALRVDAFRPANDFKRYMDHWITTMRGSEPIHPEEPILIPGDPEREKETLYRTEGIPVEDYILEELNAIAKQLNIPSVDFRGQN